ncbi:hypothetical protein AGOR_G00120090 [Albula goreensis]|uniref:Uncharacterized protein n=1 Tax=Albula goreensis TaxID=1534307 RepID=A0A8T3DBJ1_9TELE|nr:hypothetical protein AGOR_G00120090 [Albula goreensis]
MDYSGAELTARLKSEDVEEAIDSKNGYEMEENDILIKIKQEEEEEEDGDEKGWQRSKDEEVNELRVKQEEESEESMDENDPNQVAQIDGGKKNGPKTEPGQTSEVSFPVFACSLCPFIDTEEEKFQQHVEKVHPEEQNRILRPEENGTETPQPSSSMDQHPTPPQTRPTLTETPAGTPGVHTCMH